MASSGKPEDQFLDYKYSSSLHLVPHYSLSCSINGVKNVHPLFSGGSPSFYSLFPCILALHLDISKHFSKYLSHQGSDEGDRRRY